MSSRCAPFTVSIPILLGCVSVFVLVFNVVYCVVSYQFIRMLAIFCEEKVDKR